MRVCHASLTFYSDATLDEVEARLRRVLKAARRSDNVHSVPFVVLATGAPNLLATTPKVRYDDNKDLLDALGYEVVASFDVLTSNAYKLRLV